jgi:hypothetical protein
MSEGGPRVFGGRLVVARMVCFRRPEKKDLRQRAVSLGLVEKLEPRTV